MSRERVPTRAPRGAEVHMDVEAMHRLFDSAAPSLDSAAPSLDSAAPSLDSGAKTERLIMAGDLAKVALVRFRE